MSDNDNDNDCGNKSEANKNSHLEDILKAIELSNNNGKQISFEGCSNGKCCTCKGCHDCNPGSECSSCSNCRGCNNCNYTGKYNQEGAILPPDDVLIDHISQLAEQYKDAKKEDSESINKEDKDYTVEEEPKVEVLIGKRSGKPKGNIR
jgi:hypothetical protein